MASARHQQRPVRHVRPAPARSRPRRRRVPLSVTLALGLLIVVAGVATLDHGIPFAGTGRVGSSTVVIRTASAHGAVTFTRRHCRLWVWCTTQTSTSAGPGPAVPATSSEPSALALRSGAAGTGTSSVPPGPGAPTAAPVRGTSAASRQRGPSSQAVAPSGRRTPPAQQVLQQLNDARAAAGVGPLTMGDGLVGSATKHTRLMAGGCGLQHQCPGEAALEERISAEGVRWSSVGENIGYGGPVARTEAAVVGMARELTSSMLAEKPPNDGHRRNILDAGFHHVGIVASQDASGTVWLTQDFSS